MRKMAELIASDHHKLAAYDAASAKLTRERTLAFFRQHIG